MALVNEHLLKLPENYLFTDIVKRVNSFKVTHPQARIIHLGIGDVTLPIPKACVEAMQKAAGELGNPETFRGYGPEQGYDFLIEAILKHDYAAHGINFDANEIFISDGSKSDTGNIGDILRHDNSIGVTDPIYPAYIDSNVSCGRAGVLEKDGKWSNVVYMPCRIENKFVPEIPKQRIDIIYLCYPNNPTGAVLTKSELKKWVNYAIENDALIIFDAAYEAYIQDPDIPHSIYEIKGAKKVAIEFRSFSKTAGFTGVRCGYTVVPKELTAATLEGACHTGRRTDTIKQTVAQTPVHQIQWSFLYHPTGSRSHLYAGREGTSEKNGKLLHGQRQNHEKNAVENWNPVLWRRQCPLLMGKSTGEPDSMEILRQIALRSLRSKYSGSWIRS